MIQIEEQTYKEKVKMYNKCTKRELIDMLINANLILDGQDLKYRPLPDGFVNWENLSWDDLWEDF